MARLDLTLVLCSTMFLSTVSCAAPKENSQDPLTLSSLGQDYRQRYPLRTAEEKLVNNTGEGHANLYGTRNFRAVLNGVYYRGGANNAYLKPKARPNQNPLPPVGMDNLCAEGFTHAVYLYATNYNSTPKRINCRLHDTGESSSLEYTQISPLSYRESDARKLLSLVYDHIRNPKLGPIYDHCWNGWHASGYVSAITLRQFCGFTGDQAVAYWNKNTDGNNQGSKNYDEVRAKIREFSPYADMTLRAEEAAALCPNPNTLEFRTN